MTLLRLICWACLGLLAAPAMAMAPIQHWTSASGARVYFVPAPELPMLDLRLVFAAGSVYDGTRPGLAALTAAMLDEGTSSTPADEFHAALEATGATLGAGAALEMASVSLRTLSDPPTRDAALALLQALLVKPRFEPQAFARQQAMLLTGLKQELESPGTLADQLFMQTLYAGHPYGVPPEGTVAGVSGLSLPMVEAFYQQFYVANNAILMLVGDIDRAGAERVAEELTRQLKAGTAAPAVPAVTPQPPRQTHLEFDAEQTHLIIGQVAIPRGNPDHFPLVLGNHVLGGNGVVSRLFGEVREKRGLSYAVESHFEPLAQPGPFIASLQTRGEQRDEALALLKGEIARFIAEGPSAAELEDARRNLLGGFPLRIDNNAKILENLSMIAFYKLPLDYLDTWRDKMAAVTLAEVKAAVRRHLKPDAMSVITVGRAPPAAKSPAP